MSYERIGDALKPFYGSYADVLQVHFNKIRDHLGLMPQINLQREKSKEYLEIIVEPSTVPISFRGSYYWRSGSVKQELKGTALNDFLLKKMGMTWDKAIEGEVAALREMLLNALVHRNYLGSMIQLKVYDDRLTLWNAGTLPLELPIEKLHELHESIPRNPLIAEVCYKAGYIDSWGRGVEKISEACKAANLPEPQFSERSGGFLVELMQDKERLGNQLDKTQIAILTKMKIDPKISGVKLAEELGISSTAIEKQIKKLQGTGIVKRIGVTRGYWEVTKAI